jgi:hypothetical protein
LSNSPSCKLETLARGPVAHVERCAHCGCLSMHLGPMTLRLDPVALRALSRTLSEAEAVLVADHDPLDENHHAVSN